MTRLAPLSTISSASSATLRTVITVDAGSQFETTVASGGTGLIPALAPLAWQMRDPFLALRAALGSQTIRIDPNRSIHGLGQDVVSFSLDGFQVRIFLDHHTHLITATEANVGYRHMTSHDIARNAMGDIAERTEFSCWECDAGIRYPAQWDTYQNDVLLQTWILLGPPTSVLHDGAAIQLIKATLDYVAQTLQTDINTVSLSPAVNGAPDPKRTPKEIAPGIFQIPGSWYTTIVKQDDGLIIIDAPISSGYSATVLREAAKRFPGMRIKALITSTAFFWHVGGVREYARLHIPIYVRDVNVPILQKILSAPHHLVPDAYETKRVDPILLSVSKNTILGKGSNTITLIPNRLGTEPMLLTYIADAHVLHTGEMIQPLGPDGALLHPESLIEARDMISQEHLHIDRLIGMHMSPTPLATLDEAVARAFVHTDAAAPDRGNRVPRQR